ncbi:hypothetical protein TRFO_04125 [Tritrichomonas foetus]|uniref:Uncharacterized protein n=1 Tax=Tritrichomonas foetus TaxID=1144522 RepID=A0A1J4KH14_9EUKA|nr:hypothetical protein TRFO_04125 [Tritrichomonas foetus]|eukprot:OHT10633.1 hypothetical protein TRFO_04125 [Tritrichomonas foetus]
MMNRSIPIPQITIPSESDKRHVKIIPLIKVFNLNSTMSSNQPPIFAPTPPMTPRSPRSSKFTRSMRSPFSPTPQSTMFSQYDYLFDMIKSESYDDAELNMLIHRLEQRLQILRPISPKGRSSVKSMPKEKEQPILKIENSLFFEFFDSKLDAEEGQDPRDDQIKILEDKMKEIVKMILARSPNQ